jgi:glycerophosphoryl diester phosphodiesterase
MGVSVFGHRGACGYLPENTMASFELAFELGADAIEFDVVMTKDGVPVILHDADLTKTTNVATFPGFAHQVHELNLEQLRTLRVVERYPEGRAQSHLHSGKYPVPTLAEVLNHPGFNGKHLIVELKYGALFLEHGMDLVSAVAAAMASANLSGRKIQITVECFEFGILRSAKKVIGPGVDYVFLSAPDMLPQGREQLDDDLLEEIASEFDGVSVAIEMLWDREFVSRAKAFGLTVFTYTARIETAVGDVESWFIKLAQSGVDGIFADQPDVLSKTVASLT